MAFASRSLVISFLFFAAITGFAQSAYTPDAGNVGLPINGVFSGGSIDSVQLKTGNLHVDIPLLHLPGIGMDTDIHFIYDNQVFNSTQVASGPSGGNAWYLITMSRLLASVSDPLSGFMKTGEHMEQWECGVPYSVWNGNLTAVEFMSFSDPNGTAHSFPIKGFTQDVVGPCTPGSWFPNSSYSNDASGYSLNVDTFANVLSLSDKHGTRYTFGGTMNGGMVGSYVTGPAQNPEVGPTVLQYQQLTGIEDSNGNKITGVLNNGWIITDTANRKITETIDNSLFSIPSLSVESMQNQVTSIKYTDQNNVPQTITIAYSPVVIDIGNACPGGSGGPVCGAAVGSPSGPTTVKLPTSIILQNGDAYTIHYRGQDSNSPAGLGEIEYIGLPTGGTITYGWGVSPYLDRNGAGVVSRTVTQNGQSSTWQYTYALGTNTTTVTDPYLNDTVYSFGKVTQMSPVMIVSPDQEIIYSGSKAAGSPIATKTISYSCSNYTGCLNLPVSETLTWASSGQKTETDYAWDSESAMVPTGKSTVSSIWSWGNLKSKAVYDYGTGGSHGQLLSNTTYSYQHELNSTYLTPNIADRVAIASVYNSTSALPANLVAQTTTAYDTFNSGGQSSLATTTGTSQHDYSGFSASKTLRGLPTSVTRYTGAGLAPVTTYMNYNDLGKETVATDGRGNLTKFTYGPQNAFLASTTLPPTNGVSHVISQSVDLSTGLLMWKGDQNVTQTLPNGNQTIYTYDNRMRLLTETRPDGGLTKMSYPDPNHVDSFVKEDSSRNAVTVSTLDGLGRKISTATSVDAACSQLTVDTTYDLMGRVQSTSNPHCATLLSTSQATDGSTVYSYDALSRLVNKQNPDGSSQHWSINGSIIDSYDETQRHWQQTYDALSRLIKVMEPDPTKVLSSAPALETDYLYDPLGDLLRVDQWGGANGLPGDHVRRFAYDAITRLVASNNPESGSPTSGALQTCSGTTSGTYWTTCYGYDGAGNLTKKTDNRGVATNYSYDADNRLLTKTYTDTTPGVTFTYDTSSIAPPSGVAPNVTGELTQAAVSTGTTVFAKTGNYVYDAMGRLKNQQQCTPANMAACAASPYEVDSTYDLVGKPASETFPSNAPTIGSTQPAGQPLNLTFGYDVAERLTSATSSWAGNGDTKHPASLFQAPPASGSLPAYGPMGLLNATIGNNASSGTTVATLQRAYDNRGRVVSGVYVSGSTPITGSSSTGTISISGLEGQVTKTAATGSAMLTITGGEGTHSVCTTTYVQQGGNGQYWVPITTCNQVPDTGTIGITIQSSPAFVTQTTYGPGDTDQSVAAGLALALNVAGSPVTALASNNTILVMAKVAGATGNYPFTISNNVDFFANSKTTALQGGVTAGTFYDTGTMTVAVSDVTAQVSWAQGSTPAILAANLASSLNLSEGFAAGTSCVPPGQTGTGFFTACALPGSSTISIASVVSGPGADWPITVSETDTNPTYFTAPSITVTASGMSGGANTNGSALYSFLIPEQGGYESDGNLLTAVDSVTGQWNYTYDSLNRLTGASAVTSSLTGISNYYAGAQPTWTYDAFGNRKSETWGGTGTASVPTSTTASYTLASNQVSAWSMNNGLALGYDAAGNVTSDGINAYQYDAEGRLCAVDTTKNVNSANPGYIGYIYDAAGTRVARGTLSSLSCNFATNGFKATTSWALGMGAEQVTEYAVSGSAGSYTSTWAHTNAFASGSLLATYRDTDTYFALNDWLGTKRVEISAGGLSTTYRSLPFGNGLTSTGGAADATEHHFTGKERDTESGNDYFGARYYASSMGRFMSPDPSIHSAELRDPQTWNRYAYVTNNPFKYNDPTGEARNPVTNNEGLNPASARSGYGRIRATSSNSRVGEYGMVRNSDTRPHRGVDLLAPKDAALVAPQNGKVTGITGKVTDTCDKCFGLTIYVKTETGETVQLSHLNGVADGLKVGSNVEAGQAIATAGTSGNAHDMTEDQQHVHVQVTDSSGKEMDPVDYFNNPATNSQTNPLNGGSPFPAFSCSPDRCENKPPPPK